MTEGRSDLSESLKDSCDNKRDFLSSIYHERENFWQRFRLFMNPTQNRRSFILQSALLAAGIAGAESLHQFRADAGESTSIKTELLNECRPRNPLQQMLTGNARFAKAWQAAASAKTAKETYEILKSLFDYGCHTRAEVLQESQAPWAAILSCADSRVAPELIFDAVIGDLFVIRSAGNTAFNDAVASLEYAVSVLGVQLILVIGHSACGAVKAARSSKALTPLLTDLVRPIRASLTDGENLVQSIKRNANYAARQITEISPLLKESESNGKLSIRPSYFDIGSGQVTLL